VLIRTFTSREKSCARGHRRGARVAHFLPHRPCSGRARSWRERARKLSPVIVTDDVQENQHLGQEKPPSDERYVVLPGHPLYGQRVTVLGRRSSKTYTRCIIEDSAHRGFHYQVNERWLAASPPPSERLSATVQAPICLSLAAVDKMAQMILTKCQARGEATDESSSDRNADTDLDADSSPEQAPTQRTSLLPGAETGRRIAE